MSLSLNFSYNYACQKGNNFTCTGVVLVVSNSINVILQPAIAADAEALVAIQQKAFKRLYDIYQDEGSPYLRGTDEILRWLERPNCKVFK
jgi:hypothetical protein